MKILILAGGYGTRLRTIVSDVPKPLAPVGRRPYLSLMLDSLYRKGVRDVVLSVGYMAEKFSVFIEEQKNYWPDLDIQLLVESEPLGTGGALVLCHKRFADSHYLVMNGDSYCEFDLDQLVCSGLENNSVMVVARVDNISRYGEVSINENGIVEAFHEKRPTDKPGWINAGIYLVPATVINSAPQDKKFSLEEEVIPQLLKGGLLAQKAIGHFIDMGIPEDYKVLCANPGLYFANYETSSVGVANNNSHTGLSR